MQVLPGKFIVLITLVSTERFYLHITTFTYFQYSTIVVYSFLYP